MYKHIYLCTKHSVCMCTHYTCMQTQHILTHMAMYIHIYTSNPYS